MKSDNEAVCMHLKLRSTNEGLTDLGFFIHADICDSDEDGNDVVVGEMTLCKIRDLEDSLGMSSEDRKFTFFDDSGALLHLIDDFFDKDGYLKSSMDDTNSVLVIDHIEIQAQHRRKGFAAQAVKLAIELFLDHGGMAAARVNLDKADAIGFWRSAGFEVIEEQRRRRTGYVAMTKRHQSQMMMDYERQETREAATKKKRTQQACPRAGTPPRT